MRNTLRSFRACIVVVLFCSLVGAQSTNPLQSSVVPQLVKFSGKVVDEQGSPISGILGITFSIYSAQQGGSPLWMETQNVTADAKGNYTVQLGSTQAEGLPLERFSSGEARWVGVRVNGGEEQPRVLLLSVPYALKAADAETLGGKPA
jgi:trimeric autotransporter adhesin